MPAIPLFVWAVGGLIGYRMVSKAEDALLSALPWVVGGVALLAVVKLRSK